MSAQPQNPAEASDFEFAALLEAKNYRQALFAEFGSCLQGNVIEVGAGIGTMTEALLKQAGLKRGVAIEPDARFCARFRERFPGHELIQGTIADLPGGTAWDAILSINVLEHVRDDERELKRYAELLRERHGCLCLFVPAGPEIYAPIDKDFGHFRRYTRPELRAKLLGAGFRIERLHYFNWIGYFVWWLNFRVLRKRGFEAWKVRLNDRVIFPLMHACESKLVRPPFGQSLLAVARS